MERMPAPKIQYLSDISAIDAIRFEDGLAAVEVPVALLSELPLKNHERTDGPRLKRLLTSMRDRGYVSLAPIICRVGMKGRWVVTDGGHRLTAAKIVAGEFWTNLWGPKVSTLYFLLFTTPGSWRKVRAIAGELGGSETEPS